MSFSNSDKLNNTKSGSSLNGLMYLLVGGGIGAAVALLFAPKPGAELRTDISDMTRKGYDGVLDLAETVKAQSADMVGSLKEKKGQLYDFASSKFNRAEIGAESGGVKNLETGDILETNFPTSQKSAGAGRGRSSSIL